MSEKQAHIYTAISTIPAVSRISTSCTVSARYTSVATCEKLEREVSLDTAETVCPGVFYPRVSVVIPARNEARNLEHVLPRLPDCVSEVVLVDGHSMDDTIAVAQQLRPTIRVVRQDGRGKGDALRLGFAACTGDIIVMLDADGSADPGEIPHFVTALLQGYDFAKGSRFLEGGGSHDITRFRRLGNAGLSLLVNLLFWTRFSDLCYGYNAFWRHCLDVVTIDCDGFEVETLLNLRMHTARFRIIEVPSFEHPRIHGVSNLNAVRDGWRVLKTIWQEWRANMSTHLGVKLQTLLLRPAPSVSSSSAPSTPLDLPTVASHELSQLSHDVDYEMYPAPLHTVAPGKGRA